MIGWALLLVAALAGAGHAQPVDRGPGAPPSPAPNVAATDAVSLDGLAEIPVRTAFVLRDGEPRPLDAERPHPGEVVGLILEWPDDMARVPIELVAPGAQVGQAVPLRLVLADPRADGEDVLEVLLIGLGDVEIPSFLVRAPADGHSYMTAGAKLEVESTLAEDDTEPAPSRGQAGIGLDWRGIAVWVLIGAVVLGVLFAWWWRRRKRPRATPRVVVPEMPADVWARKALDRLLGDGLLDRGEIKAFHVRLAAIAKEYLSRQFSIHLMERTTAECPDDLCDAGVDRATCDEVGALLAEIDLVKFAGEHPGQADIDRSVDALRTLIEKTRPHTAPSGVGVATTPATEGAAG